MLITNENAPTYPHDRIMDFLFLRFVPRWVRPNHITILRFLLIPPVLWLVYREVWSYGVPLFLFAAFTDALDGSLARTRKQITMWGTIADPIADKLLIGLIAIIFVSRELSPWVAVAIVGLEILIGLSCYVRSCRGKMSSANIYGKMKMVFQVMGVAGLLLDRSVDNALLLPFSAVCFSLAILLAIVSLFTYGL